MSNAEILVLYYSRQGATAELARQACRGIESVDGGLSEMVLRPERFVEPGWDGIVIQEATAAKLGNDTLFQYFASGYVWRPYQFGKGW